MELFFMILFFALSTLVSSKKDSQKAKEQHRQRNVGPTPMNQPRKPVVEQQKPMQLGDFFGQLEQKLEELASQLDLEDDLDEPEEPVPPRKQQTPKKQQAPKPSPMVLQLPKKKKQQPAKPATTVVGKPLPKQTLMEQRPDREQREAHTKVAASVKPLQSSFVNTEKCEHRIELNPNISYSQQADTRKPAVARIAVKTDGDSIMQGMIWSEILGKPKAYQRRGR